MKVSYLLFIFVLTLEIVNSASLEGYVYDISLDKLDNVIVEINTIPLQRLVAKDGFYEFKSISTGTYQIKAYTNDKKLEALEEIKIAEEGTYTYDIFLIPELEDTDSRLVIWPYILSIFIIGLIIFLVFKYKKPKKQEIIDQDLDYIINIIKKEGNRIIQRDLVQKTGLSEAKISLMITDLENKGKIRKIKKGRANIIILN